MRSSHAGEDLRLVDAGDGTDGEREPAEAVQKHALQALLLYYQVVFRVIACAV